MTESIRVRPPSGSMSSAVVLIVALTACDSGSTAPTPIASTFRAPFADALDGQAANIKAGQYDNGVGCFKEAREIGGSILAPPIVVFDPPACLPLLLETFESGTWSLRYPYGSPPFSTPDHPGWTFEIGDIWGGISRNGKCQHSGEPYGHGCVSEARFSKSMTFTTSMVEAVGNGTRYRTTASVAWTFNRGKP